MTALSQPCVPGGVTAASRPASQIKDRVVGVISSPPPPPPHPPHHVPDSRVEGRGFIVLILSPCPPPPPPILPPLPPRSPSLMQLEECPVLSSRTLQINLWVEGLGQHHCSFQLSRMIDEPSQVKAERKLTNSLQSHSETSSRLETATALYSGIDLENNTYCPLVPVILGRNGKDVKGGGEGGVGWGEGGGGRGAALMNAVSAVSSFARLWPSAGVRDPSFSPVDSVILFALKLPVVPLSALLLGERVRRARLIL